MSDKSVNTVCDEKHSDTIEFNDVKKFVYDRNSAMGVIGVQPNNDIPID